MLLEFLESSGSQIDECPFLLCRCHMKFIHYKTLIISVYDKWGFDFYCYDIVILKG
jgi:hypothetical protein